LTGAIGIGAVTTGAGVAQLPLAQAGPRMIGGAEGVVGVVGVEIVGGVGMVRASSAAATGFTLESCDPDFFQTGSSPAHAFCAAPIDQKTPARRSHPACVRISASLRLTAAGLASAGHVDSFFVSLRHFERRVRKLFPKHRTGIRGNI